MSQFLIPFDPSARITGQLITNLGQDEGVLLVLNDSAVNIIFTFGDGSRRLSPAQSWRRIDLPSGNASITWNQQAILPIGVPNSQVYAESFTTGEEIPEVFPAALVRGVIGSMTVASEVLNTGNTSGTIIVQGSSSPGTGSIQMNNDGSRTTRLLDGGVSLIYENLQNGAGLGAPTAVYGNASDLPATTFNGVGNLGNTTIAQLVSAGGVSAIGHWITIARANRVHITTNGITNIIALPAPITGRYRASGYINKINATASAIQFLLTWLDPDDSLSHGQNFSCDNVGAYLNLRGSTTVGAGIFNPFPLEIDATIGQNIVIQYNDPTGTPNDYVSATLDCWVI